MILCRCMNHLLSLTEITPKVITLITSVDFQSARLERPSFFIEPISHLEALVISIIGCPCHEIVPKLAESVMKM